jgi:hypothetical protein
MADFDRGKRRSGRDVGEAPYAPGLLSRGVAATVATGRVAHQGEGVMKIDFAGKKAIVCGGSRGIGKPRETMKDWIRARIASF